MRWYKPFAIILDKSTSSFTYLPLKIKEISAPSLSYLSQYSYLMDSYLELRFMHILGKDFIF